MHTVLAFVLVCLSVWPLMRYPTAVAILIRCFLYHGDVRETILATKKTRVSRTVEERHTDTHTHTLHHLDFDCVLWGSRSLPSPFAVCN